MNLDSKDRKLLYELSTDSRQSIRSLAKKLNLSKSTVNYRINKLSKNKIILRKKAYIEYSALGISISALYMKFENVAPEIESEIIEYLSSKKEVTWLGRSYGNWELIAEFKTKSQADLIKFLSKFYNKYSQYLREKELVRYISEEIFGYKTEKRKKFESVKVNFSGEEKKMTEIERKIIDYIVENPDYKLHILASKLNISLDNARNKIKKLKKKKIISGYTVHLNFEFLDRSWYILQIEFRKHPKEEELMNFLKTHKNAYYAIGYLGKWDYEIGLCISDSEELERFIAKLKAKFPGAIKDYEFSLITKLHKVK